MKLAPIFIVLGLFAFVQCTEKIEKDVLPALRIIVTDEAKVKLNGVAVTLYANETDWKNKSNPIGSTLTTDVNGEVVFINLEAKIYFVYASKDALSNLYGIYSHESALEANTLSTLRIIIKTN